MMEYRFATPADMPELIDLIDLVFSQVRVPHDFEKLLPKVYASDTDMSGIHVIAVNEGKVRGCLGSYPLTQTMQGETLRIGYLGSMSVHRHERGSGVMKVLMESQIQAAKDQGLDMLLLGGQRQRYEYYGFYSCGGNYTYTVTRPTVRHGLRDVEANLDFAEMTDAAFAQALYERQPVTGARTAETFIACAHSYKYQPWTVLKDGQPVGYLIANASGDGISELVMENDELLPSAIKSWWEKKDLAKLEVTVPSYQKALNRFLSRFSEGYAIHQDCMMRMFKPERVILAYMKLKNSLTPLKDGKLCLKIDGFDTLAIEVKGGEIAVSPTAEAPELSLTLEEATHLIFGFNRFYAPEVSTPDGWFPLPFSVATADTF